MNHKDAEDVHEKETPQAGSLSDYSEDLAANYLERSGLPTSHAQVCTDLPDIQLADSQIGEVCKLGDHGNIQVSTVNETNQLKPGRLLESLRPLNVCEIVLPPANNVCPVPQYKPWRERQEQRDRHPRPIPSGPESPVNRPDKP